MFPVFWKIFIDQKIVPKEKKDIFKIFTMFAMGWQQASEEVDKSIPIDGFRNTASATVSLTQRITTP